MKGIRFIAVALLAPALLGLSACETVGSLGPKAPAPLAKTTIDDTALETAWRSFDLALDAINVLPIQPGSAKGKAVAAGIRRVLAALTAAESAVAAGSTDNYFVALTNAKAAIAELRVAVKG